VKENIKKTQVRLSGKGIGLCPNIQDFNKKLLNKLEKHILEKNRIIIGEPRFTLSKKGVLLCEYDYDPSEGRVHVLTKNIHVQVRRKRGSKYRSISAKHIKAGDFIHIGDGYKLVTSIEFDEKEDTVDIFFKI
jgi:hypothetical protein